MITLNCRSQIETIQAELDQEIQCRRRLEDNFALMEKEKNLLDSELKQTIHQMRRESLSRAAATHSPQQQARLNSLLQEQIETEQQFVANYKLEIQAKNEELAEKNRRLQALMIYQHEVGDLQQEFEKERLSRKLLEDNFLSVKKEKCTLEVELQQVGVIGGGGLGLCRVGLGRDY